MNQIILKALSTKLRIASSPFQAVCDSLLNLAVSICEVELAILSLKDTESHLFVSTLGIEGLNEVALEDSICTIADANCIVEVEDAGANPRLKDNPYVTGEPYIRFYAGVPVCLPTGEQLGTICVFDNVPRILQPCRANVLVNIAKIFFDVLIAQDFVLKQITKYEKLRTSEINEHSEIFS